MVRSNARTALLAMLTLTLCLALFFVKNDTNSDDIIVINFSPSDLNSQLNTIEIAKKNLFVDATSNPWRKAVMKAGGIRYKIDVRFHGTDREHIIGPQKSYAIKIRDGAAFEGMKRFSLIIPTQSFVVDEVFFHFYDELVGFNTKTGIRTLVVNGRKMGLYFMEEKLGAVHLEKNRMPNFDILRTKDYWRHGYSDAHIEPFSYAKGNTRKKIFSSKELGQLWSYYQLYSSNDVNVIKQIIDTEYWAKADAYRIIWGSSHSIAGDNLALIYNTTNGLIYPYLRAEGDISLLTMEKLRSGVYIHNQWEHYDGIAFNSIFSTLVKDDGYIKKRNMYLRQFLNHSHEIMEFFDKTAPVFLSTLKTSGNARQSVDRVIDETDMFRENLEKNFQIIERYLLEAGADTLS